MSSMNVVVLTGNLTRDPDINYAGQTADRANFGLACGRKWRDQAGQQKEETTFVDCVAWKGTAGIIAQYCKKGKKVAVVGRLHLNQWEAQDGSKRQKLVVVVNQLELLGGAPQDGPGHHGHYGQPTPPADAPSPAAASQQFVSPDDIPF